VEVEVEVVDEAVVEVVVAVADLGVETLVSSV